MYATDYAIPPHELAVEAEARGFESVWFPEHSHIPTSRKSPWPGGPELPKWYHDTYDPFVAMGAAAVVTKTIKLGTGVCLVVQRDPIHTAKEVATVDRGLRVVFFWRMAMGGAMPDISSTSGFSMRSRNCRA